MLHFQRKVPSGRKSGICSDLLVYLAKSSSKKGNIAISLRVSSKVMAKLRWRPGDYAVADYDPKTNKWTITIVDDKTGNKLSGKGRPDATGTVRFAIKQEMVSQVGITDDSGYDCRLIEGSPKSAVFQRV